MKNDRKKTFEEKSPIEARLERETLGLGRYVKKAPRSAEKRKLLLDIAVARARKAEEDDYLRVGFRRRRIKL